MVLPRPRPGRPLSLGSVLPTTDSLLQHMESTPLPIEKLIVSYYSTDSDSHDPLRPPESFWVQNAMCARAPMSQPLRVGTLKRVRELTFAFSRAHKDWWLAEVFQVSHPDVVSRPAPECLWCCSLPNCPHEKGRDPELEYYQSKGIVGDTGIRWEADVNQDWRDTLWDARSDANLLAMTADVFLDTIAARGWEAIWEHRPNVGFRGFSYGSTSCGGMWAGFRYFEGPTPRVEFSPLSWDEVKDATYACRLTNGPAEYLENFPWPFPKEHFPEMIIKVFIIREGEDPPPAEHHHCWEQVTSWSEEEESDPSLSKNVKEARLKVRGMWHLIMHRLTSWARSGEMTVPDGSEQA